jgi:uncharacterized ion transporter superfamily protein YfcC
VLKKSPDALVIISVVLLLMVALTWIIPAGSYQREMVDGAERVVAGTFAPAENNPQGIGDLLMAPIKGFQGAAHIIAFVLLVGGAFSVISATGALDAGLQEVVRFAQRNPSLRHMVVPLLMVLFSIGGCTFGMSEENLVFILITIPLARSMGYDNIVGVAIPFLGSAAGFAGAAINPFTVGIAQGIAELPIGSGAGYRWVVWTVFTAIAIIFVMRYILRLERKKVISPLAHIHDEAFGGEPVQHRFTKSHMLIIVLFVVSLMLLMHGSNSWGWYIDEICALFIGVALVAAIIARLSVGSTVKAFTKGAGDMLTAAIIIALSRSVLEVAEDGRIIDTMLHALASSVDDMPQALSVQGMFIVQGLINIFIPSGSGQAAITMPIMTPLADLLSISRQTAVLAFQFGDGLLNIIIPTSAVTMGILSIAGIPYNIWVKWVWKLVLIMTFASMAMLAIAEQFPVW